MKQIYQSQLPSIRRLTLLFLAGVITAFAQTGCSTVAPAKGRAPARDRMVQLQVFLDSQQFGPGAVDGRHGEFTVKALELYRQARKLPPGALPDVSKIQPFTTYAVRPEDIGILGAMAGEPRDLAQQKRLSYVTLAEVLAERFHTTQAFLRELNPGLDWQRLPAGAVIKVPNVDRPFAAASFPSRYPKALSSGAGARTVLVDTQTRMLEVREGARVVAAFPITPGSTAHPAPLGKWHIVGAVPWPWYRYDQGVLERGERTDDFFHLPPGPNSPVGILWAGLNRRGVGIHGTSNPETIGRAGSHGCIRLSNWDAAAFYTLIGPGTSVTIQ